MNRLYFGDNLEWLRDSREFPDASVDLVYLDPPFNSNTDYNVLFREPSGAESHAQFHAFTDANACASSVESRLRRASVSSRLLVTQAPAKGEAMVSCYTESLPKRRRNRRNKLSSNCS